MIVRITWICAMLALIGVAAANLANLAQSHPPAAIAGSGAPTDPVLRAQERFGEVRRRLHERGVAGHIGYFGDTPSARLSAEPRGIERYFTAQFILAPLILDGDGRDEWIVADFERSDSADRNRIPFGYALAADCGHGVQLFHRQ